MGRIKYIQLSKMAEVRHNDSSGLNKTLINGDRIDFERCKKIEESFEMSRVKDGVEVRTDAETAFFPNHMVVKICYEPGDPIDKVIELKKEPPPKPKPVTTPSKKTGFGRRKKA